MNNWFVHKYLLLFFLLVGIVSLSSHLYAQEPRVTYIYDDLGRLVRVITETGDAATYHYDTVGRLIRATDSLGGTIGNQYDILDRLAAQITGLGTVSYQYDAIGRRTRMDTPGQSPVTYGYDAASRLRQVIQGTQVVDLAYDALGRRTLLTLPNSVSTEYQYDAASRLTALIYRNTLGVLGDLTYQYDRAGNRTGVGGSFARALLPDPVNAATYNAANRQVSFGEQPMTFDNNGNLTSITDFTGTTLLAWDARNRLTNVAGPGATGSFTYDAFGRRVKKVINSQPTQYLYDGVNPVQELSGTTILANILGGLAIDEFYTRTDVGAGIATHFLADALGSTIALADSAGVVRTEYTYEPFGRAVVSGLANTNPFQFTGRENDGSLYYFRARYYHPGFQRFIREDPLNLASAQILRQIIPESAFIPLFLQQSPESLNLYSYVGNKPLVYTDRLGLIGLGGAAALGSGLGALGGGLGARKDPLLGGIIGGLYGLNFSPLISLVPPGPTGALVGSIVGAISGIGAAAAGSGGVVDLGDLVGGAFSGFVGGLIGGAIGGGSGAVVGTSAGLILGHGLGQLF